MHIEIDQSGKIEQTYMDTIIAFSNNNQYAVLLPRKVKRKLIDKYRSSKQIILKLFVICVYYSIKNYINEIEGIVIDREYEGKDNYIKSLLLNFIKRDCPYFDKKLIRFSVITKHSRAHEIASNAKRGYIKPQKILSEEDIEKMIQGAHK